MIHNPQIRYGAAVCLLALSALLSVGCANPGPPSPPSLHLPTPVADLAASRIGDSVELTWTTPSESTDGLALQGPLTAEICLAPNLADSACQTAKRITVHAGPSHASLVLPAMAAAGPPALLAVRVRLLNAAGHAASLSGPALTAAGVAPPPVAGLRASPSPGGATLEWTALPGAAPVLLHRSTLSAAATPQNRRPTDITLQARTAGGTDPGGVLDRSAAEGVTYRYTAERVRTVEQDGHTLLLHSPTSAAATVLIRDTFPPATPTGLGSVPSAPGAPSTIDLSWEPDTEPDLAGYLVDRAEFPASPSPPSAWTRLTPKPITAPAFRDSTVTPGHRYRYRVSAVDASGNQSSPSKPIEETAEAGTSPP